MQRIAKAFFSLLLVGFACAAQAQAYPDRPIRLIVSIAAGSVTDVIMRKAAAELQPRLSQPLIIENRGGASGIVAAQACAQAAPDGYTLCVIYHSTMSYNPLLFDKLPYNPDTDLVPVARLFFLIEGVFVQPSLKVGSVAEFKRLAQSKPDALNFATLGDGSFPDLFLRWLNNEWGTHIVGVPYKGGGPAAQALAANEVQVTRFGVGNFLGQIQGGQAQALTVSSDKRSPLLPNVPTDDEAGLGGYRGHGWWGIAAPRGTPNTIIDRVSGEFVKLFSEPDFMKFLDQQAVVPAAVGQAEFTAFLKEDRKAAEALVKLANSPREEYKP
jgi:tripartite-type tricarboxylate transporter receptor subunit TctC